MGNIANQTDSDKPKPFLQLLRQHFELEMPPKKDKKRLTEKDKEELRKQEEARKRQLAAQQAQSRVERAKRREQREQQQEGHQGDQGDQEDHGDQSDRSESHHSDHTNVSTQVSMAESDNTVIFRTETTDPGPTAATASDGQDNTQGASMMADDPANQAAALESTPLPPKAVSSALQTGPSTTQQSRPIITSEAMGEAIARARLGGQQQQTGVTTTITTGPVVPQPGTTAGLGHQFHQTTTQQNVPNPPNPRNLTTQPQPRATVIPTLPSSPPNPNTVATTAPSRIMDFDDWFERENLFEEPNATATTPQRASPGRVTTTSYNTPVPGNLGAIPKGRPNPNPSRSNRSLPRNNEQLSDSQESENLSVEAQKARIGEEFARFYPMIYKGDTVYAESYLRKWARRRERGTNPSTAELMLIEQAVQVVREAEKQDPSRFWQEDHDENWGGPNAAGQANLQQQTTVTSSPEYQPKLSTQEKPTTPANHNQSAAEQSIYFDAEGTPFLATPAAAADNQLRKMVKISSFDKPPPKFQASTPAVEQHHGQNQVSGPTLGQAQQPNTPRDMPLNQAERQQVDKGVDKYMRKQAKAISAAEQARREKIVQESDNYIKDLEERLAQAKIGRSALDWMDKDKNKRKATPNAKPSMSQGPPSNVQGAVGGGGSPPSTPNNSDSESSHDERKRRKKSSGKGSGKNNGKRNGDDRKNNGGKKEQWTKGQ